MTRTFRITHAGVPYQSDEHMVSILQGTKKENNTFVQQLETSCNTESCLDELHPISGPCMPRELSTVDYNHGVVPSIVLLNCPCGPFHFFRNQVLESPFSSKERTSPCYFPYYQEMMCSLHMLRYVPSYTLVICIPLLCCGHVCHSCTLIALSSISFTRCLCLLHRTSLSYHFLSS